MNCDHVFTILTRGPFPTGDPTDPFVESHLMRCAGCRGLAEALRPVPDYGPESVTDEESWELPVYWSQHGDGALMPSSPGVAATARAAMRRMARRSGPRRPLVDRAGLRLAGAIFLGVLFGFIWQGADGDLDETPEVRESAASINSRFERQAQRGSVEISLLQQLGLNEACYTEFPASQSEAEALVASPLSEVRYAEVACCADCHHRQGSAAKASASVMVIKRCAACHPGNR